MNESCRVFCPLAEACFLQHEALTAAQKSVEREQQQVTQEYTGKWKEFQGIEAHQQDTLRFAHVAAVLMHEGVTGDLDADSTMDQLLEDLLQDERKRQTKLGELVLSSQKHTEMEEQRMRGSQKLESSHYSLVLLEEARQVCPGPELRLTGKMLLARAALLNWLGLAPANSYPIYKFRISKKYAKCVQPKAHEAAEVYKNLNAA